MEGDFHFTLSVPVPCSYMCFFTLCLLIQSLKQSCEVVVSCFICQKTEAQRKEQAPGHGVGDSVRSCPRALGDRASALGLVRDFTQNDLVIHSAVSSEHR